MSDTTKNFDTELLDKLAMFKYNMHFADRTFLQRAHVASWAYSIKQAIADYIIGEDELDKAEQALYSSRDFPEVERDLMRKHQRTLLWGEEKESE